MSKLECTSTLKSHNGCAWNVKWHPNGQTLASCGDDQHVCIWTQTPAQKWIKTLLTGGHTRTIRQVAWSPCGNYLASASFDATIAIWDKNSGEFQCNLTLEGHENEVKSVAWNHSGQLLSTCSRDKSVWVWEITDAAEYEVECAAVLNAHTQDVKKVIWHPEEDIIASASYDDTIKLYKEDMDENDWCCIATLKSHASTVWSIAFDKTGTRLVSCSDDRTVKVWQKYDPHTAMNTTDEETWKCVCTLSGYHDRAIYDIDWCHATGLIATACGDNKIRIFAETVGSGRDEPVFEMVCVTTDAHPDDVNSVHWNTVEAGTLASCGDDGTVKIWKLM